MREETQHWPSATDVAIVTGTTDNIPKQEYKQLSLREAVARGEILRMQKPRAPREEKECKIVGLDFIKVPRQRSRYASSNHIHRNYRPKNKPRNCGSYDLSTPKNYKKRFTCSMRIQELAVPKKRTCLETWRENCHILPSIMISRLREHVLGHGPVLKVDDAIRCFQSKRTRKTSSENKSKRKRTLKTVNDMDELKFICGKFACAVSKRLVTPLKIRLTYEQRNIARVVTHDIKQIMKSRNKSANKFRDLGYNKILLDVSNMVAVWIDAILAESSNKYWIEALRELDEEEGPVLDILDSIVDDIGKSEDEFVSPPKISADIDKPLEGGDRMIPVETAADVLIDGSEDVKEKDILQEGDTTDTLPVEDDTLDVHTFIADDVAELIKVVTGDSVADVDKQDQIENTEEDELKKVTFDALGADQLKESQIKRISTENLNPPNYNLLSDADESWPPDFTPANPNSLETVKKSVTSLGKIKEGSDKISTLEGIDDPKLDKSKEVDDINTGSENQSRKSHDVVNDGGNELNLTSENNQAGEDIYTEIKKDDSISIIEEIKDRGENEILTDTKQDDENLEINETQKHSTEEEENYQTDDEKSTETKNYETNIQIEDDQATDVLRETKDVDKIIESYNQSSEEVSDPTGELLTETKYDDKNQETENESKQSSEGEIEPTEELPSETYDLIENQEGENQSKKSSEKVKEPTEELFTEINDLIENKESQNQTKISREEVTEPTEELLTETNYFVQNKESEIQSKKSSEQVKEPIDELLPETNDFIENKESENQTKTPREEVEEHTETNDFVENKESEKQSKRSSEQVKEPIDELLPETKDFIEHKESENQTKTPREEVEEHTEELHTETNYFVQNKESEIQSKKSSEQVKEPIDELLPETNDFIENKESENQTKTPREEVEEHTETNDFVENKESENQSKKSSEQVKEPIDELLPETNDFIENKESENQTKTPREEAEEHTEELHTETKDFVENKESENHSKKSSQQVKEQVKIEELHLTNYFIENQESKNKSNQSSEEEAKYEKPEELSTETKNDNVRPESENKSPYTFEETEVTQNKEEPILSTNSHKYSHGSLLNNQGIATQKTAEESSDAFADLISKSISEMIKEISYDQIAIEATTESTEDMKSSVKTLATEPKPSNEVNYVKLEVLDTNETRRYENIEVESASKAIGDEGVSKISVDIKPALKDEEDKGKGTVETKATEDQITVILKKVKEKTSVSKKPEQPRKQVAPRQIKKPDIKTKPKAKPPKFSIRKSPARSASQAIQKFNEKKEITIPPEALPERKVSEIAEAHNTQRGFEYKVCLETAPSWVFDQGKGEPSEDSLVTQSKHRERQQLTQSKLRQWCRDLEVTAKNLEKWSNWLDDASNNIIYLKQMKMSMLGAKAKELEGQQKLWMDLKTSIDKDSVLWSKISKRALRKLVKYNRMPKYEMGPSDNKVLCPCKM